MTDAVVAVALVVAIIAPHLLDLDRVKPVTAAGIWLGALGLRALTATLTVIAVLLWFPTTQLFQLVTYWCWHTVLPFLAQHLPLDGYAIGGFAVVLPLLLLLASLLSVSFGLWRAARGVRRLLEATTVGPGPQESLVLADGDVLVAAAGLRRPQVVISAGALTLLDDEELAASLAHERGHIDHRHRWILVLAELFWAFARFLPGTRAASRELQFHLERDADAFAVSHAHDPAALASAICKAAVRNPFGTTVTRLGGGSVARRIRLLLDGDAAPGRPRDRLAPKAVATAIAVATALGFGALPAAGHAALHERAPSPAPQHCDP